jgi:hypothetical protein
MSPLSHCGEKADVILQFSAPLNPGCEKYV